MITTTNHVYFFTFKSVLNSLNGIYRVSALFSYPELVKMGVDLFKITYKEYGLSDIVFNNDLETIRSGKIAKLTSVNDESKIIFIPEHLYDKVPDGSVQRYYQLGLAVNLGIFNDPELLSTIRNEIEQVLSSMLGVTNNTIIYTVKDKWMTTDEYKDIEDDRNSLISKVSNHYTDKLMLIREIDSLKTRIQYYEHILKHVKEYSCRYIPQI